MLSHYMAELKLIIILRKLFVFEDSMFFDIAASIIDQYELFLLHMKFILYLS